MPGGCGPARAIVPPLLRMAATTLVTQHGCDSHVEDRSHTWRSQWTARVLCGPARVVPRALLRPVAAEVVADTRWSTWCREPGPTCSPRQPGYPSIPRPRCRSRGGSVMIRFGRRGPARMTDGNTAEYDDWSAGYDPETGSTRPSWRPGGLVFPWHGIDLVGDLLPHQSHAHLRCGHAVLTDRVVEHATGTARSGAMSTKGQSGGLGEVRFLTVAEGVASAMRVSKMTVYGLVHASTLPAIQVRPVLPDSRAGRFRPARLVRPSGRRARSASRRLAGGG